MTHDRPPPVAEEIADLPPLGTKACEAYIREHGDQLRPETLVYLLRGYSSGETSLFPVAGRLLIGEAGPDNRWREGHCEQIIMGMARHYGFHTDPELLREYRAECHAEIWRAIHAGYEKKPFWEHRFGRAVKDMCIQVARKVVRGRKRADQEQPLPESEGGEELLPDLKILEDEVLGRIAEQDLLRAIRRLPERQALAALLTWVEDLPIEGEADCTVSGVMGISERGVYKLLAKARGALMDDPMVRKHRGNA